MGGFISYICELVREKREARGVTYGPVRLVSAHVVVYPRKCRIVYHVCRYSKVLRALQNAFDDRWDSGIFNVNLWACELV